MARPSSWLACWWSRHRVSRQRAAHRSHCIRCPPACQAPGPVKNMWLFSATCAILSAEEQRLRAATEKCSEELSVCKRPSAISCSVMNPSVPPGSICRGTRAGGPWAARNGTSRRSRGPIPSARLPGSSPERGQRLEALRLPHVLLHGGIVPLHPGDAPAGDAVYL